MWLVTTRGFYSVVQKPWDVEAGTLTVRGRVREDLEGLRALFDAPSAIVEDRRADYRFRFRAPKLEVAQVVMTLLLGIDYDNFKDAVKAKQGLDRAQVYGRVWSELFVLQMPRAQWGDPVAVYDESALELPWPPEDHDEEEVTDGTL